MVPTGTSRTAPSDVSTRAVTTSCDAGPNRPPPERCAKKRIVGCSRPTHMVEVTTELPAGIESALDSPAPWTCHGSWSATTRARPAFQPPSEPSKLPPGARKYWLPSPHWENGCDTAPL